MCKVIESKSVKTRKPHQCWGCTKTIEKGSQVAVVTSVDMGEISRGYWCDDCNSLDAPELIGECFGFGDFQQLVEEIRGEG